MAVQLRLHSIAQDSVVDSRAKGRAQPDEAVLYAALYKISVHIVFQWYQRLQELSNCKRMKYVRILTFPTPNAVYGYEREWYEEGAEIEFEGCAFLGISYLRFKFGNHLELPPEEA